MTQEEKQLLLKDICARLPYGVKGLHREQVRELFTIDGREVNSACIQVDSYDAWFSVDTFKPYLRPMSSMTEEERQEFSIFIGKTEVYTQQICLDADSMANPIIGGYQCVYWGLFDRCIDWLNSHHFDYRGLIEKGLALEAPEGMYEQD